MKPLIYLFLISLISCVTWDARLTINNNTNRNIYYYYQITNLNDTILNSSDCDKTNLYDIPANSKQVISSPNKWNVVLDDNKILRLFIFDRDTVNKIGVCNAFNENKYLKRFDLTLMKLKEINWQVDYTR